MYPGAGVSKICGLFGLSRQSYYSYIARVVKKEFKTTLVLEMARRVREVHPKMGCRKIYELIKPELAQLGVKMGRDKLFDVFSDNQLLVLKRKRQTVTTNSYHHFRKYKNQIRGFVSYKPNQLWVSDITYVRKDKEFQYLFLITDAYSHKVIGYKIGKSLETKHAESCLKMALTSTPETEGIIHHSDRGIQYCSHKYVKLLQDNEMRISMTENGNPLDNSIAERMNGILKEEYIKPLMKRHDLPMEELIDQSIYRYNYLRPHLSCDMMTPEKAHRKEGILKKRWKNYYKLETQIN